MIIFYIPFSDVSSGTAMKFFVVEMTEIIVEVECAVVESVAIEVEIVEVVVVGREVLLVEWLVPRAVVATEFAVTGEVVVGSICCAPYTRGGKYS